MSDAVTQFFAEYFATDAPSLGTILGTSIGILPDPLIPRAARLSYRIVDPSVRESVQRGLRLRLGDADEEARLTTALKVVRASDEPEKDKAQTFVYLTRCFPKRLPKKLAAEAHTFVELLDDQIVRTQALCALAPHLPKAKKILVLKRVRQVSRLPYYHVKIEALQKEGYRYLAFPLGLTKFEVELQRLVEKLAESDRVTLFDRALDMAEEQLPPSPPVETPAVPPPGGGLESVIVRKAQERVVNTGFAPTRLPGDGIERSAPLMPGIDYLFWLEIGEQLPASIEVTPTALPVELLPSEARLHVVLFGFKGELEIDRAADVGEIQLTPDGLARVVRQPIAEGATPLISDRLDRRLYFPVRTPAKEGPVRLRCNIYCRQVLVQSRLVTATVRAMPTEHDPPAQSIVDYTLTESLNLRDVAALRPHAFSLMINDSGPSTHGFRFFGSDAKPINVTLPAGFVSGWIRQGRERLRRVSWNDIKEWTKGTPFRYEAATTKLSDLGTSARATLLKQCTSDLGRLAVGGYRIYRELSIALGSSRNPKIEGMIRQAGPTQIAIRMQDRLVFPAALVYDYHFDTSKFDIGKGDFELCPVFSKAMLADAPLEDCACFGDGCPVRVKGDALKRGGLLADLGPLICPSGFWGYRHALGMPLTLTPAGEGSEAAPADAPGFILFPDQPHVASGISTDPDLQQFPAHEKALKTRAPGIDWRMATTTREDVLKMLMAKDVQIIYLYCHGGVLSDETPFLSVGHDEEPITPENVSGVQWGRSNPLVFINGCHTTALDPDKALDFVSTFVDASAGGVVGTEITISESLACTFAEECLSRFLVPDGAGETRTLGDAVRGARLALLKMGNPLGLVYIPFAVESLRLKQSA
jgi:hypothetical protein